MVALLIGIVGTVISVRAIWNGVTRGDPIREQAVNTNVHNYLEPLRAIVSVVLFMLDLFVGRSPTAPSFGGAARNSSFGKTADTVVVD